jgi:hypothetical protein
MSKDNAAAKIHREKAERDFAASERFRKLGLTNSATAALRFARCEDEIAHMLETGKEPR